MSRATAITRIVVEPLPAEIHVADALALLANVEVIAPPDVAGMVAALASGVEVLVTSSWDDSLLQPSLKWLQATSAGIEQFPGSRLAEDGVVFTSARGIQAPAVAEHAFAMLLALTRGLHRAIRGGPNVPWKTGVGGEIGGMTIGVLGFGAIGEEIGARAQAWGLRVIGLKRHPENHGAGADVVLGTDSLLELFEQADFVVCALPSTPENRHLIGRKEFAALAGGYFINVGRGSVVDEVCLVEALRSGVLHGAGLDVFDEEPLPSTSPLWHLENVIITPHVAGLSSHFGPRLARLFERNLEAFHGRGRWVNRVSA